MAAQLSNDLHPHSPRIWWVAESWTNQALQYCLYCIENWSKWNTDEPFPNIDVVEKKAFPDENFPKGEEFPKQGFFPLTFEMSVSIIAREYICELLHITTYKGFKKRIEFPI